MAITKTKYRTGTNGLTYLRVSSRGQVETEYDPEGMSLPAQRRKCAERAKENGITFVGELIDSGITATSIDQRQSYKDLIERVRTDTSIAFVMVYSLSRLHRNWAEAGVMVMQLRSLGVRILSATEQIDDRTPEGQMMQGIMFAVSGFQSAASSQDLQNKMAQKAIVGGTPGYVPPGYLNVREHFEGRTVNTVALDPDRAPFIPMAFEWFATGQYTYEQLRERLTEAGFRSRPTRNLPARAVSKHTVESMLRNRYYLGWVTWNGTEYKGRHEPLVTQDLWDRVQHVLTVMPGAGNRQRRYNHYLKGMLYCRRCDRRMIVSRGKSKTGDLYFYYVCRGRQDRLCDLPYIRAVQLEQAIANHYHSVRVESELRRKVIDGIDEAIAGEGSNDEARKSSLEKRLADLDRQEDRYIELATDPDWPREKLTQKIREVRDQKARVQATLNQTTEQIERGRATARQMLIYLDNPHELYGRSDVRERAKLNRMMFKRFKIDLTDELDVDVDDEMLEPFASIVHVQRERNRPRRKASPPYLRENERSAVLAGPTEDGPSLSFLLQEALGPKALEGSRKDNLAERVGFEPTRR